MPIGKNALKRVANNGYSNVSVSAPDMEHSEIIENALAEEKSALTKSGNTENAAEVKKEEKKPSPKSEPAKKKSAAPKTKKSIDKKAQANTEDVTHPDGFVKFAFGMDLPTYLL